MKVYTLKHYILTNRALAGVLPPPDLLYVHCFRLLTVLTLKWPPVHTNADIVNFKFSRSVAETTYAILCMQEMCAGRPTWEAHAWVTHR